MTGTGNGVRLLGLVLGLFLLFRAVNKDATGRTLIDRILGNKSSKSPLLAAGSSSPASSGTGKILSAGAGVLGSLFPKGTGVQVNRHDQGLDLKVKPGTPVLANGNGYLVRNGSDPSGFGDSYPIVHFTSGPWAGLDVYFGHIKSLLSGSQTFQAGQSVGVTQQGTGPFVGNATVPGWLEVGNAPAGNPGTFGQPLLPGLP